VIVRRGRDGGGGDVPGGLPGGGLAEKGLAGGGPSDGQASEMIWMAMEGGGEIAEGEPAVGGGRFTHVAVETAPVLVEAVQGLRIEGVDPGVETAAD